jgi:predicted HTH domain antitoxin
MTLKLETPNDQLTLRVPEDPKERERWAVALYDPGAVTRTQAAHIAGVSLSSF